MHIVLLEPEIPQNAGNIARTCAVTNSVLHLIKPLGFSVEDKYLKRAGLDYWKLLDIRYYENFEDFCERNPNAKIWMASTKARHIYADVTYGENDYIMFGKESAGIPEEILMAHEANTIRIPMLEAARSLNLSNSVAIIIYEAMRQQRGSCTIINGKNEKNDPKFFFESLFFICLFLFLLAFLLSAYPPSGVHPLAFPSPAFPPQGAQGVRSQGMRQMP